MDPYSFLAAFKYISLMGGIIFTKEDEEPQAGRIFYLSDSTAQRNSGIMGGRIYPNRPIGVFE